MVSPETLAERMDALAAALRDAGVPQDRAARLLGTAAEATMRALVLDAVLDENAAPAAAGLEQRSAQAEPPLRVAT
jgi:hypothetical protein